MLNKVAN